MRLLLLTLGTQGDVQPFVALGVGIVIFPFLGLGVEHPVWALLFVLSGSALMALVGNMPEGWIFSAFSIGRNQLPYAALALLEREGATLETLELPQFGRALANGSDGQTIQVRAPNGQVVSGVARLGGLVEVAY